MLIRTLTGIVFVAVLFTLIYFGGIVFWLGITAFSIIGIMEMRNILKSADVKDMWFFDALAAAVIPSVIYFRPSVIPAAIFFVIAVGFVNSLANYPDGDFKDFGAHLLGAIYVSMGFSHMLLLRNMENGMILVAFVFFVTMGSDVFAYLVGCSIGKTPFFRYISPKKSVEGFIGGTLGGILFGIGFIVMAKQYFAIDNSVLLCLLTPFLSIAGTAGDLYESTLKRRADVKDSGNLLPGHGGILDRMDSALFVFPLLYYLLFFVNEFFNL